MSDAVRHVYKLEDEITRLTAENDQLRAGNKHLLSALNEHGGRYWEARYRDEAAENERLRAALRVICEGPRDANKTYVDLFFEVVREARAALKGESNGEEVENP